ncbi:MULTISPECIES: class GN sortase [Methylorubrum]|uniref:Sortase (Surface protein transpeptidase) n=2 Tax=Methylorubrum extorquens TaxID=408 RepID=C5AYN4_METEA|nr:MULTISPECIES: class GN sortase [Methylorubrum]ACS39150.1 putative sortase (surface protein transpeptidase) precursor [Methylorubrum extorquens AM1]EHP78313.1 sortase [Methylorubrum extorquens DSM 13060]MCP1542744.1 sortase A [Methylorubrum extorquens]MCP1589911.1 sortase A [Methylorubrum extorquens]BDL38733.1 class GN sortase [Methylorubrum sp. GM97]
MSGHAQQGAASRRSGRKGFAALPALLLVAAGLVLLAQAAWIPAKAALAQVLLERAFTRTLAEGVPARPWPWADTVPVARIGFPRLGERYVVLAGSSGQALAFGPGHVEGTPEAGEPGIAVYAAHRDTQFRSLGRLAVGDAITVERRDRVTVRFRVTGRRVARWDASGLDPQAPGRHLVLATCWPLDAVTPGPERLLVEAVLDETAEP